MPHSTRAASMTRIPEFKFPGDAKDNIRTSMERFPDHIDSTPGQPSYYSTPSKANGYLNGNAPVAERWQPRKDSRVGDTRPHGDRRGHGRQPSLSEALRNVRRRASVSANVHEIGDALKAPVSPLLISLCIIWYLSSALTNTSSKSILNAFPKPATLTMVQFGFVTSLCIFFSWLSTVFPILKQKVPSLRHGIRYPTREVIKTTLPLAAFQIGGHLLSSTATAQIPVSLVHTIKGLSPLFTVFAYRVVFDIRYPIATYLSLIPLTLGVILACSTEFKGNFFGIFYAFLAAIIFVTQNIFSKRLFNQAAEAEAAGHHVQSRKLDKLNLLCYSAGLAFILTTPIWFWSEGITLLRDFLHDGALDLEEHPAAFDHGRLALEFVFNGTFHFGQNIIAFVLLSMVSPVTYSVASLIKRVFVVVVAIVWFQNPTTKIQAAGIALTFFGLYLYDRTKSDKVDRKAKLLNTKEEPLLPINTKNLSGPSVFDPSPLSASAHPYTNGYSAGASTGEDSKKTDDGVRVGRTRGQSNAAWLPPGTRQEETWRPRESSTGMNGSHVSVQ
ncbi:hypothetical protein BP5796_01135 [Coleophoma crateriformis]|uniref:Sugar phosphate transporter domain-containing protein n=1 Tax=Coleophoma crateriformis TaxID=565419 RepID=A0A3D8T9W4_9HELO|nr:hypothetical protein BP5796_01135 [Coleophoma crateriformis]